jgi:probable phosphoglycerate mutase
MPHVAAPRGDVVLVRHGETEWSLSGQHTGLTDIPLTERGREEAKLLEPLLAHADFALVLSSPLQRARETCKLAGLGRSMEIEPNTLGDEISADDELFVVVPAVEQSRLKWLTNDGCPGGESPEQVGVRVDHVIRRVRSIAGRVAVFAHGHVLRVSRRAGSGFRPPSAATFCSTRRRYACSATTEAPRGEAMECPIRLRR